MAIATSITAPFWLKHAMLAAILYTVHVLSLPRGSTAVLWPSATQALMEPVLYRRPSTVALDSGAVAVVVQTSGNQTANVGQDWWKRTSSERIVINDGGMHVLPFPTVNTLAQRFVDPRATGLMFVRDVVLTAGKKAVIAIGAEVDGASESEQEASFAWNGTRWDPALPLLGGIMPQNVWVAAADSRGILAYVGDYLYLGPAKLQNPRADNLFNVAMTYQGQHAAVLGRGVITAVSRNRAVGYDDGYVPGGNGLTPVRALEWTGYIRTILGAGIAWSVNAEGDVVGDDRKTLRSIGIPMLWHNGKSIRLSDGQGTAYAIADDGTIVGAVRSRAFLIPPNDPNHHLTFLDDVVTDGWHVTAAYYIASNGNILALATRKGTPPSLVVLHRLRR